VNLVRYLSRKSRLSSWHKSYNSFRFYIVYMKTFRSISKWCQQLSEQQINVNFNDVSKETQIICNLQCNVPLSWPPVVPLNCIQTNLKQTKTKFFVNVSSVTVHWTIVFTYFHYSTKYYERHRKLFIGRPCKKRADDLLQLSRHKLKMAVAIITGRVPLRGQL
jgi:hypothetical protein